MKKSSTFKAVIAMTCAMRFLTGGFAAADTVKISGGSLMFWGTISTSTSGKDDSWDTIGWILIIAGALSGSEDSAQGQTITAQTEIAMYSGDQKPQTLQTKVAAKTLLQKIEMDSLVAAFDSQLASSLPMAEIIGQYHMNPQRVGNVLVQAKRFGNTILGGKEIGDKVIAVDYAAVTYQLGNLSKDEAHIVANYLRLRNIRVIGI